MTNEEKLKIIVADPLLWIKHFCVIVDKEGRKVPFEPTYHQKLLSKNFKKYNLVAKSFNTYRSRYRMYDNELFT